ncbi:MAG: PAS domain-containing protein [Janthinobacterium lividum]
MVNSSTVASLPTLIENEFQFLADFIPQLVWITDPTGFHIYFNQRWTDYTGYTLADSVGPDMWNNLLHPDDRARARQIWGHALATGEDYEIEYRFKATDGGYRWFLGQARPRFDEAGNIVVWFGTCTDIHDQKIAAEQLQQREQDFMTLANAIPQMAWMADATGYIFWYNERWYTYTGATLTEMEGDGWKTVQHPDHVAEVATKYSASIAAGEPWQDVFPLRGQDGQYRWFLSRALPVRDTDGQIVRWCGTNTDITEEKHLQEQLVNSYADLEAKVTFRNLELEHEVQDLRKQLAK